MAAAITTGLTHLAVSVPTGTLTPAWRRDFLDFYGSVLGWTEIENAPRPDRFTVAIGGGCYMNIRERAVAMACTDYEHFGVSVQSAEDAEALFVQLGGSGTDLELGQMVRSDEGTRSFRFRYLLPLAMEIQYFSPGASDMSPRPWAAP